MLAPGDVERARAELAEASAILLQLEVPLETVYATVALGVALGVPVFLNPAPARADLDLSRLRGLAFLLPNSPNSRYWTDKPVTTIAEPKLLPYRHCGRHCRSRRNAGSRRRALRNGGFGRARARAARHAGRYVRRR